MNESQLAEMNRQQLEELGLMSEDEMNGDVSPKGLHSQRRKSLE